MPFKKVRILNTARHCLDELFHRSRLKALPTKIHLEINNYCNLKCKMCARQYSDEPKDNAEIPLSLVEKISHYFRYATHVGIAGNGEPFLHNDLIPILKTIISKGAVPSILTNATLLTETTIRELMTLGPSILMCSIDGATKETFEEIRRGASFAQVKANLTLLRSLKKEASCPFPITAFIVCLMKDNIGELPAIVAFAHEMGASQFVVQHVIPYSSDIADRVVNDETQIRSSVGQTRLAAKKLGMMFEYLPFASASDKEVTYNIVSFEDETEVYVEPVPGASFSCENIMRQLHIDVMGRIRYCCLWTKGYIGSAHEDDLGKIWNHPGFLRLRENLFRGIRGDDCVGCANCVPAKRISHITTGFNDCVRILSQK